METKEQVREKSERESFISYHTLTKSTIVTPEVKFDINHGKLEIKGRSLPADSLSFYSPIIQNLETFGGKALKVNFNLEYFNTSSARCIFDMFRSLKKLSNNGVSIDITWKADPEDEDMKEMGKDFSNLIDIPFQYELV